MQNTTICTNVLPNNLLNDLNKDWDNILKKALYSDSYQKFLSNKEIEFEKECDEFAKLPTIYDNFLYVQSLKPYQIVEVVDSGLFEIETLAKYISFEFSKNVEKLKKNTLLCFGITIADFCGTTLQTKILRVLDHKKVYKKINKLYETWRECFANRKYKQDYISKSCFFKMKNKKIKQAEYLKTKYVYSSFKNDLNFNDVTAQMIDSKDVYAFSLFDAQQKAKKSKLAQIYATSLSMQNVAKTANYKFLFATFTCPSKYHIRSAIWDKKSIDDSNFYLTSIWRNITKRVNEADFDTFGAWTKEAHKDGTLHKHALFFVDGSNIDELKSIILNIVKYAFEKEGEQIVYNTSVNFKVDYVKAEKGDGKASAASYIFKYILKTLTNIHEDLTAVEAHAMQFSYRRYAFFGIERCATVWQYLYKFKDVFNADENCDNDLKKLIKYVNDNDYMGFVGDSALRKKISFIYDYSTNKYGETTKKIIGFKINKFTFQSKINYKVISLVEFQEKFY